MSSLLFPVCKLDRANTQSESICDILLDKGKGSGGTVNRISDYAEAVVPWASIENVL